jgi:hypothetical protein
VKVVSLFSSHAINLDMERLNAKQSYYVIFVQARNTYRALPDLEATLFNGTSMWL